MIFTLFCDISEKIEKRLDTNFITEADILEEIENNKIMKKNKPTENIDAIEPNGSQDTTIPSTECNKNIQDLIISTEIQKFKLPIAYLETNDVYSLNETVANDLELTLSSTSTSDKPMYNYLFQPKHSFAEYLIPNWKTQYTTNTEFLKNTQEIVKNMETYKTELSSTDCSFKKNYVLNCDKISDIWRTLKTDTFFLEKYSFIDWDYFKYLNKSQSFLQILSYVNVSAPLLSLLIPIILFVFPFLLLRIQNIPISFSTYLTTLKTIAKNHFIGKTLFSLENFSWDKMVYVLFTFALYGLQIYQNVNTCIRFYNNINKINDVLFEMREYTKYSVDSMTSFLNIASSCPAYSGFCQDVEKQREQLHEINDKLKHVKTAKFNIHNFNETGYLLKCFYELYESTKYEECFRFSMGFEAYMNNLLGIFHNYKAGNVSFAEFNTNYKKSCTFREQYYPPLLDNEPVKNTCSFDKNMIISSPNKSGKTTILKTTTINIIFSQQFGCGFYTSAILNPYTHIHSYLNIPDTSGRDSLFQAESRRCKEIIDIIHDNKEPDKYRHFCIFDELYSGTNPDEACKAGYAFLKYLSSFPNVNFILTTHYISICKKFRKSKQIQNYKMDVNILYDGNFYYTYKMKKGISKLKGALRVLKDMDYPKEIIDNMEKNITK